MPFFPEKFLHKHLEHNNYANALAQLKQGHKTGHWIWYIFPQISGLGQSATAREWELKDIHEACAYLHHPQLLAHYREILVVVDEKLQQGLPIAALMGGHPDDFKLISSVTLFSAAAECLATDSATADTDARSYQHLAVVCHRVLSAVQQQNYPPCEFTLHRLAAVDQNQVGVSNEQKKPAANSQSEKKLVPAKQTKKVELKPHIPVQQQPTPLAQSSMPSSPIKPKTITNVVYTEEKKQPVQEPPAVSNQAPQKGETSLAQSAIALSQEIAAHISYLKAEIAKKNANSHHAKVRLWQQKLQTLEAVQKVLVDTKAKYLMTYYSTKLKSPQYAKGLFANTPKLLTKFEAILPQTYEFRCLELKANVDHYLERLKEKLTNKSGKQVMLWQQKIAVLTAVSTALNQSMKGNKNTDELTKSLVANKNYAKGMFSNTEKLVEKSLQILSKK